eukprot:CAMPEP_0168433836 /NCGR_PEP_ID=MMETSP0228-20121227/39601_1 /TAXON_ID=133427 /ORGANISM="Protoceratium reticulatum, Strain CCCM 535 (=CCMP 1889)" /LENGTH=184 /DNA_ID=CAMNT_0008447985 /DNA_START=9 /DNA_END=561 /DNA_ORIENTATION=-
MEMTTAVPLAQNPPNTCESAAERIAAITIGALRAGGVREDGLDVDPLHARAVLVPASLPAQAPACLQHAPARVGRGLDGGQVEVEAVVGAAREALPILAPGQHNDGGQGHGSAEHLRLACRQQARHCSHVLLLQHHRDEPAPAIPLCPDSGLNLGLSDGPLERQHHSVDHLSQELPLGPRVGPP